jgi:hypothetical protein
MNKRPAVVKVLANLWTIEWDKTLIDKYYLENDKKVYAFIEFEELRIVVNPNLPESICQETLLHEIQHACYQIVNDAIDAPDEEQYVTIGTPILLSTLKDPVNKDVFDYIFG